MERIIGNAYRPKPKLDLIPKNRRENLVVPDTRLLSSRFTLSKRRFIKTYLPEITDEQSVQSGEQPQISRLQRIRRALVV